MWCDASIHQTKCRLKVHLEVSIDETRVLQGPHPLEESQKQQLQQQLQQQQQQQQNQPTNKPTTNNNHFSHLTTNTTPTPFQNLSKKKYSPDGWGPELWNSFEMDHQSQVCSPLVATFHGWAFTDVNRWGLVGGKPESGPVIGWNGYVYRALKVGLKGEIPGTFA